MTAETAPRQERQGREQNGYHPMVGYGVVLVWAAHTVLLDRRFHVAVIVGVLGTLAWFDLIKNNEAQPARRAIHWYTKVGASRELALKHQQARHELDRVGRTLERGKRS